MCIFKIYLVLNGCFVFNLVFDQGYNYIVEECVDYILYPLPTPVSQFILNLDLINGLRLSY